MCVREETVYTRFSREVRRLGVQTSDERIWRDMYERTLTGRQHTFEYSQIRAKCGLLMDLFDALKTPDEDRRAILSVVLQRLQAGQVSEIDEQIDILGEKVRGKNGVKH